jgi:hypothetical protein
MVMRTFDSRSPLGTDLSLVAPPVSGQPLTSYLSGDRTGSFDVVSCRRARRHFFDFVAISEAEAGQIIARVHAEAADESRLP